MLPISSDSFVTIQTLYILNFALFEKATHTFIDIEL